jgi:hypothetical protein
MAKIYPQALSPDTVNGAPGRYVIRDTKQGIVAQAWPKKQKPAKSGYRYYQQTEFGIAGRWAANPLSIDYMSAVEMAKGTEQVPRDVLMSAMMGTYYEIITEDGQVWKGGRVTNPNVQYILDTLDPEVGAVIFRDEIGWIAMAPGEDGEVLTMQLGKPAWLPNEGGGGGGGGNKLCYSWQVQADTLNFATQGNRFRSYQPMAVEKVGCLISGVIGAVYKMTVWHLTGTTLTTLLGETVTWIPVTSGNLYYELPLDVVANFLPGNDYAVLVTRTDATATTPCLLRWNNQLATGAFLENQGGDIRLASVLPAPGNSVTIVGNWRCCTLRGDW